MNKSFVCLPFDDFDFLVLEEYVCLSILTDTKTMEENNFKVNYNHQNVNCFNCFNLIDESFRKYVKSEISVVLIFNTSDFSSVPEFLAKENYIGICFSCYPVVKELPVNNFAPLNGFLGNFERNKGLSAVRFTEDKIQYLVDFDKILLTYGESNDKSVDC